ncbi:hypothetical protein BCR37DRAFT_383417 [Protomyces lactucae-debilis]|uniref:Uncharacterized protein n=1 Tax=Protomyces lactucae-debilis TaxID=2754530 RepID=A0A1Y2EYL2_PROLT|nr:uncharacterized protein BCR37DRAFT_383417 [Protomyces lactucae-debilis]ORY76334.1 hypothetical protein BCR37DRAFT_383417 [Protomyces lactucae-debilis]
MNMNPFTTECVCQTVVHFMRFYHPLKTYPQAISNDDEGLDEDHACSPSNVLQRIHSKSGWGTTGVPPYVDGKEVSCDNQPGNGWCDHDGVYHKGDH